MQSVVERTQIGVHLLLQVARQEPQALPSFNSRPGENQALHLAFGEHPNRENGGKKSFAGAGRAEGKGEVVALHGIHVFLLAQRARAQQVALLALRQHLLTHGGVVIAAAGVESAQGRLKVYR